MKHILENILSATRGRSRAQAFPWILLAAAVSLFLLFIINLQKQNNVDQILQKLREDQEIITLDEWQAIPYHCPHMSQTLEHCELLSATETTVTFPRIEHFFPKLFKQETEKDKKGKVPNAARMKYRFKIHELDWMKNPKRANALLLSLVIPRTSQDLMFVYTDPAGASQHGGRMVNVVANFGREDLLQNAGINVDILAPSLKNQFGPLTLPIAIMTPSRTTPYLNLLNQMKASSLPATLLALMLPVLAAAMAVILDSSKVMFHISGYAFVRGVQALLAQTLNTLDGRAFFLFGIPVSWPTLRSIFLATIMAALIWLAYILSQLVLHPQSRLFRTRSRMFFAFICAVLFFFIALPSISGKSPVYQMERLSDIVIGSATLLLALHSYWIVRKAAHDPQSTALTIHPESEENLFNPTHHFAFRSGLVTITTLLMAFASLRDLRSSTSGGMAYDPLDWRQLILVPVLLLCAVLGVGSITQKMNEYAQIMRRRVEQLMLGSRTLASSSHDITAVLAAIQIIGKEIKSLESASVEILLPGDSAKQIRVFNIKMGESEFAENVAPSSVREGHHPLPDELHTLTSDRLLIIQLFQESRWQGSMTFECHSSLFLTHEEKNFIHVTQQTLSLTLDNLKAINELRRADKLKDDFLANTSHELRTPLHGIIGIAESLLAGAEGSLAGRMRENLNLIAISGRRLSNLVNDLLDFSQIKQRELKLRIGPVEIRPMVQLVLALSKPLLGGKPVTLLNEVEPELPAAACDEARLQQILQNLIGNAIKFTQTGRVVVSAKVEGRLLRILVKDTGIGIHPSKKQRIFNSFEQADGSINRVYGGTGLGLTITKQLVELQGGTIQVESEPDVGSEFSFTLPLAQPDLGKPAIELSSTPVKQHRPTLLDGKSVWWENAEREPEKATTPTVPSFEATGHKVLVIDDDPINRKVLENQISSEKYQIFLAEDGISGLQTLNNVKPDIVLLDLMMPRMSGFDVLTEIRKSRSAAELPVIILTAKNQMTDLISCFHAGANDFLMKPFAQSELLARMRNHLQISKVHGAYTRFIPQDFLQLLGRDSIVDVRLGDQIQRDMSVMFLDIRQFSKLSEGMSPKENFDFLNEYYGTVNPVIRRNAGFIDKYIGDAVMALFTNRPDDALLAGIDLLRELEAYNNQRKTTFRNPIAIGIGIHHGPLMLGTLGNEDRMEGTVISDSVNLASRLETMTKIFSANIITSQDSILLTHNPRQFQFRSLGKVRPAGFSRSLNIVEVFSGDSALQRELKVKTLETHETSLRAFHSAQWDAAIDGWKKNLQENPADRVAALYLDRAVRNKQNPPGEDWDGVFDMRGR